MASNVCSCSVNSYLAPEGYNYFSDLIGIR